MGGIGILQKQSKIQSFANSVDSDTCGPLELHFHVAGCTAFSCDCEFSIATPRWSSDERTTSWNRQAKSS
jgi:hypothetical protein